MNGLLQGTNLQGLNREAKIAVKVILAGAITANLVVLGGDPRKLAGAIVGGTMVVASAFIGEPRNLPRDRKELAETIVKGPVLLAQLLALGASGALRALGGESRELAGAIMGGNIVLGLSLASVVKEELAAGALLGTRVKRLAEGALLGTIVSGTLGVSSAVGGTALSGCLTCALALLGIGTLGLEKLKKARQKSELEKNIDFRDIVLPCVNKNGLLLRDFPDPYRADKEVVLAAVGQNGLSLIYAVKSLRADKEVVLAAVGQNGLSLRHAAESLQADKEVVLAAVSQNGFSLRYAAESLQADKEVVLAAVNQNKYALGCADLEIRRRVLTLSETNFYADLELQEIITIIESVYKKYS